MGFFYAPLSVCVNCVAFKFAPCFLAILRMDDETVYSYAMNSGGDLFISLKLFYADIAGLFAKGHDFMAASVI